MMIDRTEREQQPNYHPQQSVISPLNQQYFQHQQQQQQPFQMMITNHTMGQQPASSLIAPYLAPTQAQASQHQQLRILNNQIETPNQQQSEHELIGYYFGSISRETAEWILKTHGNFADGAYLLRSSGPNDDFVLSLMVNHSLPQAVNSQNININSNLEFLHYKIVETEDSFVALHGQVGDEKFATIDELIDKAQGVASKPRWPILRQSLDSQILPPTYWGLSVDQVRLAILIKAKQWGFPLLSSLFQSPQLLQQQHQQQPVQQNCNLSSALNVTTLNNETIRTLIYKSLHEFQPWFHGKISREEAERRIDEGRHRDGKFLVRERDNYSYAMCISHKKTTKHYRIDVLPTGELAIQDGRKFTSLMALVSHYTIMNDGLWCALTEACPRPIAVVANILPASQLESNKSFVPPNNHLPNISCQPRINQNQFNSANQNMYCLPQINGGFVNATVIDKQIPLPNSSVDLSVKQNNLPPQSNVVPSLKAPIKEWLHTINHKWSQLMAAKNQHHSINSFLFGTQNPLNNHCKHERRDHNHLASHRRKCKNGHLSCGCIQQLTNGRSCRMNHAGNMTQQTGMQVIGNPYLIRANENHLSKQLNDSYNCCNSKSCSTNLDRDSQSQIFQNNFFKGTEDQSSNSLLCRLPQNSGFTLSSQSFIGSPLFAVRKNIVDIPSGARSGSSSNSGSGGGSIINHNVDEEKLISPVQSVTGINHYNLNHDIYGSQTSTALINDTILNSSNSSSSNNNYLIQKDPTQMINMKRNSNAGKAVMNNNNRQQSLPQIGQILCGQHAGPAYRYTNGNDENSFKPCYHRFPSTHRASDDSQLVQSSSQFVGPAAMTKFVQFQDGHCLRTHRDTQSIQLAYLSARQAPNSQKNSVQANHPPLREIKVQPNSLQYLRNNISYNNPQVNLCKPSKNNGLLGSNQNGEHNSRRTFQNNQINIDLMDWNEENAFDFKYDPKMIKSSSIETLCGIETEDEVKKKNEEEELEKFKSNSELMMSLQAYWAPSSINSNTMHNTILSPVPVSYSTEIDGNKITNDSSSKQGEALNLCMAEYGDSSILSSIITENNKHNEELDHMRKKHDLDELTTALLAELTASLKAQVDLKNKQSGVGASGCSQNTGKFTDIQEKNQITQQDHSYDSSGITKGVVEVNPLELINEFDTLISKNTNR